MEDNKHAFKALAVFLMCLIREGLKLTNPPFIFVLLIYNTINGIINVSYKV